MTKPRVVTPCPQKNCLGTLVVRTNKQSGGDFLGCNRWPECDYTRPLTEDIKMRRAGYVSFFD